MPAEKPSPADPAAEPRAYVSAAEIAARKPAHIRHPWNPRSDVYLTRLSVMAGLQRVALYIARVPPGKESFLYHRHERDEEFLYILSGHGRAEIGEEIIEIGPGDFMGFPAPGGPAHHLTNPYKEDLVYLMGGESSGFDIGHFPRLKKHMVFAATGIVGFADADATPMSFADYIVPEEEEPEDMA